MLKSDVNVNEVIRPEALPPKQPTSRVEDELPPQQGFLRRLGKRPELMHYNRLIALMIIINLAYVGLITKGTWRLGDIPLTLLSNLAIVNFTFAILLRQQYVINLFFKIATSVPTSWPLAIRHLMGKVYHFGGMHVGGVMMGTIWFSAIAASMTVRLMNGGEGVSLATVIVTYAILAILLVMVGFATPKYRARYHDMFEMTHRFGGWTVLLLFWIQTILFANDQREPLLASLGFWLLLLVTFSVALPWLRLKKVPVKIVKPSDHVALAQFNYGVTPFEGSSTTLSRSPLTEWHPFANIPAPDTEGFRLAISRVGDWTGAFIDDMPSHVWVKGIPTAGVGNIEKLFKRVIWVATGSGVGPCVPHLLTQKVPAKLVWSTRNPRKTYGNLVDEILSVQPHAVIWDTDKNGRPDLVRLAYEAYKDFDAEAVIVISNKKLTWQVVYGMESRGIPAYGAIWDS